MGIAGLATVVFEIIGVEHVRMDMDHFQVPLIMSPHDPSTQNHGSVENDIVFVER